MTTPRDPDALLVSYLADGMEVLPDRVVDAVLDEVHRTPQRAVFGPLRTRSMFKTAFGAAAVFAVLVVGGTLYLGQRSQPAVVAGPSQTPIASPSEPPGPSAGPSAAVVQPASGLIVFMTRTGGVGPQLWVANADGTGKHELAPGGCQGLPSWSPDGTRLLFSGNTCGFMTGDLGDAGTRLYLTDASGSLPQLLDTRCVGPCVSDSHGVFSIDGRRILFSRLNIVDAQPEATPGLFGKPAQPVQVRVLATMDLETGRVTELGDAQDASSFPDWSPDRSQVVFDGCPMPRAGCPFDPDIPPTSASENPGTAQVFVADVDGRNVRRLTPSGWSGSSGAAFNDGTRAIFSGAWSADGTWILFRGIQHASAGNEIRLTSDIYIVRPDGTGLRRLTTDGISSDPAWSVDARIWFLRTAGVGGNQADGPTQYWIMDADGGNATKSSLGPQPQDLAATARQPRP